MCLFGERMLHSVEVTRTRTPETTSFSAFVGQTVSNIQTLIGWSEAMRLELRF